jgi:hypothetical protein
MWNRPSWNQLLRWADAASVGESRDFECMRNGAGMLGTQMLADTPVELWSFASHTQDVASEEPISSQGTQILSRSAVVSFCSTGRGHQSFDQITWC